MAMLKDCARENHTTAQDPEMVKASPLSILSSGNLPDDSGLYALLTSVLCDLFPEENLKRYYESRNKSLGSIVCQARK